jgi:hypothetical protein
VGPPCNCQHAARHAASKALRVFSGGACSRQLQLAAWWLHILLLMPICTGWSWRAAAGLDPLQVDQHLLSILPAAHTPLAVAADLRMYAGGVLLLGGGTGLGQLSLPVLAAVFITSAVLGDAVNYAIGNKLGEHPVRNRGPVDWTRLCHFGRKKVNAHPQYSAGPFLDRCRMDRHGERCNPHPRKRPLPVQGTAHMPAVASHHPQGPLSPVTSAPVHAMGC